jgi:hypothetical protein
MAEEPTDRRRSIRRNECGLVVVVVACQAGFEQIAGVLIDANDGGFRARHPYSAFQPGEKVSFLHRFCEGVARVFWHEALNSEYETGFSYGDRLHCP